MAKKNLKYSAEKIDELLTKADEQMATKSDLAKKVDKVDGKGLSTNDYSTAEKAKLAGIQEGAQKNAVTSVRGALQLNPQVGNVVISAADIGLGNANTRLTSLENNKLDKSEKGATNGVASLDENGRVPSSQLPSYVDDVIEVANYESLPTSGESGKIYITQSDNKTYRWSGNGYAEISASLTLGETEQTAYSGAKGKKNAEDIAKLAKDLDETHLLASNAESAISEVVELTIPTIESEVANKATKTEAQGYATTAESNANDYTNSAVDDLAKGQVATNKANIASLQTAQTSLSATVKTNTNNITTHTQQIANLDSSKLGKTEQAADSAKLGGVAAADYMQKSGGTFTGNVTAPKFIGALQGNADSATNASQLEGMSILHGWTGANSGVPFVGSDGVMEFGRMIDFHIASEPSGADFATRLRCQETVTGVQVYLPSTSGTLAVKTDTVDNANKLGGVAASGYAQLSGAQFTGDSAVQGVFRVNTAADNRNCLAILAEIATGVNQGMAHMGTNYGYSNMGGGFTQNIIYAMSIYRGMVGIGRSFTYAELYAAYKDGRPLTVDGNAVITGTMTATASYHDINYTTSDERLKDFEGDVEVDLEKLKTLPKKYFKWKEHPERGRTLGTSAQALQKIYPELVDTRTDGMLSVNYEGLSVVALAAIDKLADQNAELAKENAELTKQNAKLAEKNAELERRLAKIEKLLNIE